MRREGRPIHYPAWAPGRLIVEQLDALALPMHEFARRLGISRGTAWRFLHGKVGFSNRITMGDICRALELSGDRQVAFLRAYKASIQARDHPETHIGKPAPAPQRPSINPATAAQASETGTTSAALATFLRERIAGRGLSCALFARTLGVAPSTISRLLRGKIARTHVLGYQAIARALELDGTDRQTFLKLARDAGIFALPSGAPARLSFTPLEQSLGAPLEALEAQLVQLRGRREGGDIASVHEYVHRLFVQLFDTPAPTGHLLKSPELARLKLQVGFELCQTQAAILPWYERVTSMLNTLDRMQIDVLQYFPFPPRQFLSEYGHIVNLRAPLYRELPRSQAGRTPFDEGLGQFNWALEVIMPGLHEPTLHIEMLRNRAHLHVLKGDIRGWRHDLMLAERIAATVAAGERDMWEALVTYSWGEGYKRLANRVDLFPMQRREYRRHALDALRPSSKTFDGATAWAGYALLARIAEVQCLLPLDRDEATRRATQLRLQAQRVYPALVQKIDRALPSM